MRRWSESSVSALVTNKKIASVVLRYLSVHKTCQSVLYFQNVKRSLGISVTVIPSTPTIEGRTSLRRLLWTQDHSVKLNEYPQLPISSTTGENAENMGEISLAPLCKLRISLYRFSRNNQLLTDTDGSRQVQQTPKRPRTMQVRLEIRLRPTKVWLVTEQIFTKLMLTVQRSGKKFYIEFHENPTNCLTAAARSLADRQTERHSHDIRSTTFVS
jgi:hypothetical protein